MVVIGRRAVPGTALAAVLPVWTPASAAAATKTPTDPLSRARWASLVGSTSTPKSATSAWSARLSTREDLPGATQGSDRRYVLRFTSTSAAVEGTFSFSRSGLSATSVHLVPGSKGRSWTGVVNRL